MTDILTSARVRLRAPEPADAEAMMSWANVRDFRTYLNLRYPLSLAQEVAWVAGPAPAYGSALFAATLVSTGELIGHVDLRTGLPEDRVAELGISIGRTALRGQGLGTEMLVLVCGFGFDEMDLARISLTVHEGNERARRAYERVGFVHEGTARQALRKAGRRLDLHLYGLLPGELRRDAAD